MKNHSNVTKEGIEVKVGQVWEDLDVRMGGRTCIVQLLDGPRAKMARCRVDGSAPSKNSTHVAISRMHKASTGWKLIKDVA